MKAHNIPYKKRVIAAFSAKMIKNLKRLSELHIFEGNEEVNLTYPFFTSYSILHLLLFNELEFI